MKGKVVGLLLVAVLAIGCAEAEMPTEAVQADTQEYFLNAIDAEEASPANLSCEIVTQVPQSRGRGKGLEGKYNETVVYYPGYLRGDINGDGLVTREDAMLAVKKFFKPENFDCPRTADIGGYPRTLEPDGFFTSQDTVLWNEFKHSNVPSWELDVICAYDCDIPNHMQP